jgi:HK97 family phage portal protein
MAWLKELRTSLENPSTPLSYPAEWLLDIFNGGRTDSGIRVSEMTALQVTTVYTCVDIISSSLAALPLNVYEQLEENATRLAWEQETHFLLHDEPNPEMTSYTFRKTLQAHALLWGNLYAEVQRDASNRPVHLWPRAPNQTKPRRAAERLAFRNPGGIPQVIEAGELFYVTTEGTSGGERFIPAGDMIHIPGLSLDGRIGKDIVGLARQAIGLALAMEKYGAKVFSNGLRPTGVVELPSTMKAPAIENFKRSIQEAYGGENQHRPIVLELGMKWTNQEIKNNEGQYLESRAHVREDLSAFFHVPVRMVGESGKANRSTSEQEAIEFVQYTLRPWTTPWEQELKRKLFPKQGRSAGKYFPGFDVEDLLLPDADSRGKYFALGKQWGFFNSNDVRKKLRMNPITGPAGEAYWMPVNMQDAASPMSAEHGQGATGGPGDDTPDPDAKAMARAHQVIFGEAFRKTLGRGKRCIETFSGIFRPVLTSFTESFKVSAEVDFRSLDDVELSADVAKAVNDHIGGMLHRSAEWTDDSECCDRELQKASRAMKIAVYRDLATMKAKELRPKEEQHVEA